jgi:hypothetical protein
MDTHIFLPKGDESCRQAIVHHGSSTTHKDVHNIDLQDGAFKDVVH